MRSGPLQRPHHVVATLPQGRPGGSLGFASALHAEQHSPSGESEALPYPRRIPSFAPPCFRQIGPCRKDSCELNHSWKGGSRERGALELKPTILRTHTRLWVGSSLAIASEVRLRDAAPLRWASPDAIPDVLDRLRGHKKAVPVSLASEVLDSQSERKRKVRRGTDLLLVLAAREVAVLAQVGGQWPPRRDTRSVGRTDVRFRYDSSAGATAARGPVSAGLLEETGREASTVAFEQPDTPADGFRLGFVWAAHCVPGRACCCLRARFTHLDQSDGAALR